MPEFKSVVTIPARPMGCGGCGGNLFTLYSGDTSVEVLAECQGCKSVSRISVERPRLAIDWNDRFDGADSDGMLALRP